MSKSLERILYAEDEPDIQEVAGLALEAVGGFTLKICDNGQIAVDAVGDFQPDLLLLDVMMPTMDGPSALKAIRSLPGYENLPAIFMTAKVQPNEVGEYKAMGALDVIPKPFDPMTLADTVREIWERGQG
ncbi:MAG: response regulator [Magnetococcales bacterium]|nr:response regulator [Magnetococcales bacterium]